MTPEFEDELASINSIYDEGTFEVVSNAPANSSSSEGGKICALRLPSLPSVVLRIEFPADYPDAPPAVLGTQSVGDDVPKGFGTRVVELVRNVLGNVYRAGEPCVFDVVEEVGEMVQRERDDAAAAAAQGNEEDGLSDPEHHQLEEGSSKSARHAHRGDAEHVQIEDLGPEPPWTLSEPVAEKKSVFLARAAPVDDVAAAKRFVAHLLATDKKAAKATHNITAWRIRGQAGAAFQDCDDDGETAAGGRVLHLMQLMDVWDVVVVVTRWYGGIQLGPDRFRIINQTARDALVRGGFVKEEKKEQGKKKGKK